MDISRRVYVVTGVDLKGNVNECVSTVVHNSKEDAINSIINLTVEFDCEFDDQTLQTIRSWDDNKQKLVVNFIPGEPVYFVFSSHDVTL